MLFSFIIDRKHERILKLMFLYMYIVGMICRALHQLEIHYFFWAVDWEIVCLCSLVAEWDPQDWHPV